MFELNTRFCFIQRSRALKNSSLSIEVLLLILT